MVAATAKSRSDERRQAILDVAGEIFLQEGYAAASMSAIAARLGGSKGTLYNYFTCKTDLFAAFMVEACHAHSEALFATVEDDTPIGEALGRIGRGFLSFILDDVALAVHRLVVAEAHRFPELGKAFYEAGPKVSTERMAAWLQVRMDRGELRRTDARVAARQFLVLCKSGPYSTRIWNLQPTVSQAEIDRQVDATVDMFLAAYGTAHG